MSQTITHFMLPALSLSIGLLLMQQLQAEDAKPMEVKAGDITLTVPATWKSTKPTNRLRLAQFTIPAVGGDAEPAELVIYFFGGNGGGVDANLQRWINSFQPKGRVVRTLEGTSKQGKYVLVDVRLAHLFSGRPSRLQDPECWQWFSTWKGKGTTSSS